MSTNLTKQQIKDIMTFYEGKEDEDKEITKKIKLNRLSSLGKNELECFYNSVLDEAYTFSHPDKHNNNAEEIERYQKSIYDVISTLNAEKKNRKGINSVCIDISYLKSLASDNIIYPQQQNRWR